MLRPVYVADISFANLVTSRTINVLRFEGDLIQGSEIQEESPAELDRAE